MRRSVAGFTLKRTSAGRECCFRALASFVNGMKCACIGSLFISLTCGFCQGSLSASILLQISKAEMKEYNLSFMISIRLSVYIEQNRVTRNGTLKSTTNPWKMETTTNCCPAVRVMMGSVVSIVVAPPAEMGARLPNQRTSKGQPVVSVSRDWCWRAVRWFPIRLLYIRWWRYWRVSSSQSPSLQPGNPSGNGVSVSGWLRQNLPAYPEWSW